MVPTSVIQHMLVMTTDLAARYFRRSPSLAREIKAVARPCAHEVLPRPDDELLDLVEITDTRLNFPRQGFVLGQLVLREWISVANFV